MNKRKNKKELRIVEVFRDKMARSLRRNLAQTQEDAKRWHCTEGQAELLALANRITAELYESRKGIRK